MWTVVRGYSLSLFFHLRPLNFLMLKPTVLATPTSGQMSSQLRPTHNSCPGEQLQASQASREHPGAQVSRPRAWQCAGKQSSLESSWALPSCCSCQHLYLHQPVGLIYSVSERFMPVISLGGGGSGASPLKTPSTWLSEPSIWCWGRVTPSRLPTLTASFLPVPFASVKPAPHHPPTVQCPPPLPHRSHPASPGSTAFSLFPQQPMETSPSPHTYSLDPVFKGHFFILPLQQNLSTWIF